MHSKKGTYPIELFLFKEKRTETRQRLAWQTKAALVDIEEVEHEVQ